MKCLKDHFNKCNKRGGNKLKENLLNRKTYKEIKKYNREQMENFLRIVYTEGFRDGVDAGDRTDFRIKLSQVLNNTKGIGPILYSRIMENAKEVE